MLKDVKVEASPSVERKLLAPLQWYIVAWYLLNLITERNPWKSTSFWFQAYLQDPMNFLLSVLPISAEVTEIFLYDTRHRLAQPHQHRRITARGQGGTVTTFCCGWRRVRG